MRLVLALLLALPAVTSTIAEEAFSVVAPIGKQRKLVRLEVVENEGGVSIQTQSELPLSFAPGGIAAGPKSTDIVVTGGRKEKPSVAVVGFGSDGTLQEKSTSNLEHPAGYTSVDRSGRYLLTANYGGGLIASYRITGSTVAGKATCLVKTPNKEAHCILTTRDNRFVYIPCVKLNNALYQYSFDAASGKIEPLRPHDARPPAMFGPRHVAYHPNLPIAYFSNEQQLGVSVYSISDDGQLSDLQHATTTTRRSPYESGKRDLHASDLAVTPDGKLLFVAVRDFVGDRDAVYTFRIEPDGRLSKIARTSVGDIPWKIALSPTASLLLVSESGDERLSVYQIMPTGKLNNVVSHQWNAGVRDMVIR